MDLERLKIVLTDLDRGAIETVALDTIEPSPFSHEILNANPYAYLDDAPLEERRTRAVQMRRALNEEAASEIGALDPSAILEVQDESWPLMRDADELHDALLTLYVLPPIGQAGVLFDELAARGRATVVHAGGSDFWAAAERLTSVSLLYPGASLEPAIVSAERAPASDRDTAATEVVRGWMESTGPTTAAALAARLAQAESVIDGALLALESQGQVLRGRFTPGVRPGVVEWCNRRLLARIHRLTLGRLRKEIEPVTTSEFVRFLGLWQHVAPGSQLAGVDGVARVIQQLQGYEVLAGAWESDVLRPRVTGYSPELLDRLCLSGEVMWGRLSPQRATDLPQEDSAARVRTNGHRVRPTRAAPVAMFLRQDAGWLVDQEQVGESTSSLSSAARAVFENLATRGASFAATLTHATGLSAADVEHALWELVTAGLVTADGFDNLRSLVRPKRPRRVRRTRASLGRQAGGRWTLLHGDAGSPDGKPRADAFAKQLLSRWGVVFRDLLARETLAPPWRDLLIVLRRLEARAEIRGGRFVAGFLGEQFALPEAVELLRASRRSAAAGISVASADPLNLAGILLPGPRVNPLSGRRVEL
jgi:ATP-dependent Lhr-like helicase